MFNNSNPSLSSASQLLCVWLYVAMLSSLLLNYGAMAILWVPLVVVREINCGRAVNYSSGGLKGPEPTLAPVHHTFIRAQSVPMGPLSIRSERPQPGNINDMDHRKRLFSVQAERENGQKERGREARASREILNIARPLCVKQNWMEECITMDHTFSKKNLDG